MTRSMEEQFKEIKRRKKMGREMKEAAATALDGSPEIYLPRTVPESFFSGAIIFFLPPEKMELLSPLPSSFPHSKSALSLPHYSIPSNFAPVPSSHSKEEEEVKNRNGRRRNEAGEGFSVLKMKQVLEKIYSLLLTYHCCGHTGNRTLENQPFFHYLRCLWEGRWDVGLSMLPQQGYVKRQRCISLAAIASSFRTLKLGSSSGVPFSPPSLCLLLGKMGQEQNFLDSQ